MRIVLQRVTQASVQIDEIITAKIESGFMVLLGIENDDQEDDLKWLIHKLNGLRIFNDDKGKMNLSIQDIKGAFLVISQFTLFASCQKGNRPSFIKSANPEIAKPLYHQFITELEEVSKLKVKTGEFGADMKISLVNDGPVTIILDSKNKEL